MSVWNILGSLISPIVTLIDNLHTSDEERLALKAKMMETQSALATQMLAYEQQLIAAQSRIITAEAQGQSWLQRNWRPITMLCFLGLVVADTFGWTAFRLSADAWVLLQIGLGGYVVGRSAEKISPHLRPPAQPQSTKVVQ
jgi:hypothetical protein